MSDKLSRAERKERGRLKREKYEQQISAAFAEAARDLKKAGTKSTPDMLCDAVQPKIDRLYKECPQETNLIDDAVTTFIQQLVRHLITEPEADMEEQ